LERWIKGSAILGCVGCLVGHLFMFLVGGKTPDQSVHLNLTTTVFSNSLSQRKIRTRLSSVSYSMIIVRQAAYNPPGSGHNPCS
ncbi:hypothetical protein, partial [Klebsiella pneumoniae]|uniref:hypothetical protein n=1 Tax=Klebsiella pneumoniae TaxID=573 RepID=UPI0024B34C75